MTREEAKWWANHLFEIRKEEYFNKGMMEDAKEVEEAQHMAIEALDKMAELPSIDIVHCKECKWAGRDEHCPAIEVHMICGADGYCSCGESEEQEND